MSRRDTKGKGKEIRKVKIEKARGGERKRDGGFRGKGKGERGILSISNVK